ncbi:MAG: hypothetical protein IKZ87_01150 [Actinomycetaceae bacterium]|nr:hypothetical protein [Actinomycetaceae bacterium]
MNTWHNTYLDPSTRILIHDGLLIEYAPGHVLEADLARYKEFRAKAIARLISSKHTAIARTALWVHTGFLYTDCMPRLTTAHPYSSKPYVTSRRDVHDDCCQKVGALRITTAACTAFELLLTESPQQALQGIRTLYDAGLVTPQEIAEHIDHDSSRNGSRKARAAFEKLSSKL